MKSVCVLLSTYNGEKYLREQLDSIRSQNLEGTDCKLSCVFVRDDGSKDKTVEMLNEYKQEFPLFPLEIVTGENIGFSMSFSYLIKNAPKSDFYALCDQDDVWLENKIKVGVLALEKEDENIPLLYGTSTIVVDKNLKVLNEDNNKNYNNESPFVFQETLLCTKINGCTMIFNEVLRSLYKRVPSENIVSHDRTLSILATGLGKQIYSHKSQILYRQHENNTYGNPNDSFRNMCKAVKRFFSTEIKSFRYREALIYRQIFFDELSEEKKHFVYLLTEYKYSHKIKRELSKYIRKNIKDKVANNFGKYLLFFGRL